MSLPLIISCFIIIIILIILPLIVSRFAEKKSKKSEWDRIKEYGNKINDETRKTIVIKKYKNSFIGLSCFICLSIKMFFQICYIVP